MRLVFYGDKKFRSVKVRDWFYFTRRSFTSLMMAMLMLKLQFYLRAKSCNRVTTAAPWESSSVVFRTVQAARMMILGMRVERYFVKYKGLGNIQLDQAITTLYIL